MKTRNWVIICLMIVGVVVFGIVQGSVIPHITQEKQQYISEQKDPLTHDIGGILKYKSRYMGNASNIANLFYSLPLSNLEMSFQLRPEILKLEVNYKGDIPFRTISEDKVKQSFIYNATAAFSLIDNLEAIQFKIDGTSYNVVRSHVEQWYGVKLATLTEADTWASLVQSKLNDSKYLQEVFNHFFNR